MNGKDNIEGSTALSMDCNIREGKTAECFICIPTTVVANTLVRLYFCANVIDLFVVCELYDKIDILLRPHAMCNVILTSQNLQESIKRHLCFIS